MRVLGIDPGSNYMGLGCVEASGSRLRCVGHRVVRVKAEASSAWATRLKVIFNSVTEAIEEWKPDAVSVEQVFFAKNAESALKLGQARGAALTAAVVKNLPVYEYAPTQIKRAITSSGRADKQQVYQMVRLLLGESLELAGELDRHDASDALAIAICHTQQNIQLAGLQREGKTLA